MSPAMSTEEDGLMSYLQSPPGAGPAINQPQVFKVGNAQVEDLCKFEEEGQFCFPTEVKRRASCES